MFSGLESGCRMIGGQSVARKILALETTKIKCKQSPL